MPARPPPGRVAAHPDPGTPCRCGPRSNGLWRSIFYSAIGGWILLLAFLFAVKDPQDITDHYGAVGTLLGDALSSGFFKAVILISTIGQFFCGMSCVTSMSRMTYAFSRDGAVPGWRIWTRLDPQRHAGLRRHRRLCHRPGVDAARAVPEGGRADRWVAITEIIVVSIYFILPYSANGVPFKKGFGVTLFNYSPVAMGGLTLVIALWWYLSARKWFTGPRRTVDLPEGVATADAPVEALD